jgi:hypothetical protein
MIEGSIKVAVLPLSINATSLVVPIVMNNENILASDAVPDIACSESCNSGLSCSSCAISELIWSSPSVSDGRSSSTTIRCSCVLNLQILLCPGTHGS